MSYWYRLIRPILGIVTVVALLSIAALTALPYVVSTDAIRLHLAQGISAWTGYSVEIRQPPRLRFFPTFRASLSDVTLSKIGDDTAPLMAAERIEVDLSPLDALFGRISFSQTRLINPHFTLSEPVADLPQFIDTLANSSGRLGRAIRSARELVERNADKADVSTIDSSQLSAQPFGRLIIENGSLNFHTVSSGRLEQITAIHAGFEWPQTTRAATLKGNALWHDETVDYNMTANQALLLLANGMSQINLQINSKPLSVSFNGRANIAEDLFSEGAFSLNSPSLHQSLHWLGLSSSMIGKNASTADNKDAFSIESNVSITPSRIKLADIALNINGMPAKGAAEIAFHPQRPAITGTLAFQNFDAGSFFYTAASLLTKVKDEENKASVNPVAPRMIDNALLDTADMDLRLSAQTATVSSIQMTGLAAALQVRDGHVIFDIGDAKAFKGSIQASLNLGKTEDGQDQVNLRLNGSNIASNSFLAALGLPEPFLSGQGNISITAQTMLNSWKTMLQNAKGQVTLSLNNGRMQGFDLNDFISKVKSEGFFALQRRENITLDFTRMDIKATIGDGVATLESAKTETARGILSLGGILPLTDRSLALSGSLTMPPETAPQAQVQPQQQMPDATPQTDQTVQPESPAGLPPQGSTQTEPQTPPKTMPLPPAQMPSVLHFFVGGSWDRPFISPAR